ncbi:hypothetical protein LCGC14_0282340 [marine sediment metagenome]|uniref:Uncharacterized protein n=1 Tax=marine sediment metagenome TaxID=412755 RepID=A0A0F9TVJ9_9ZZZZ
MLNTRPEYEALDSQGYPYMRQARVVGELPSKDCRTALDEAVGMISREVGLTAVRPLSFGLAAFHAFGMNHREACRHAHSRLLLTQGVDLPLDYIPAYNSDCSNKP